MLSACGSAPRITSPTRGYVKSTYGYVEYAPDENEIDNIAEKKVAALDRCYLLPIAAFAGQTMVNLEDGAAAKWPASGAELGIRFCVSPGL